MLRLRPQEEKAVLALLGHYFLQSFGLVLIFLIANTWFLATFGIQQLPVVYIFSAILMLLGGRVYAWFEHHASLKRVFLGVTVTMLVSAVVFGWGMNTIDMAILPILLMVLYRFLYLLGKLEFWGLAAVLFDVRQARRLFGIISVGDIPAKLLGSLAVALLVPVLGLKNVIWLSCVAFAGSYLVLNRIIKQAHLSHGDHHEHHSLPAPEGVHEGSFWKKWFSTNLVSALSLLSIVAISVLSLMDYAFLAEVQYAFKKSEAQLAKFFGLFFAASYGFIIIFKVFLTPRLLDRLGIRWVLLLLPVLLVCIAIGVVVFYPISQEEQLLLIAFATMMLLDEVLYKSMNEPVGLVLFQPLPQHVRLHGHTITKAVMEPIGLGIVGIGLFLFHTVYPKIDLFHLDYVILALALAWVGVTLFTTKLYSSTLRSSIHSRFMTDGETLTIDSAAQKMVEEKLESAETEEIIYALRLLERASEEAYINALRRMLHHGKEEVKDYVLQQIATRRQQLPVEEIVPCLASPSLELSAAKALAVQEEDVNEYLIPMLDSDKPLLRREAIQLLLLRGELEGLIVAGEKLLSLKNSASMDDRAIAAGIIGNLSLPSFYKPVHDLIYQEDEKVQTQALEAAGKLGHPKLLPAVLDFLGHPILWRTSMKALGGFGAAGMLALGNFLFNSENRISRRNLLEAVHTAELAGGEAGFALLEKLSRWPDAEIDHAALMHLEKLAAREIRIVGEEGWRRLEEETQLLEDAQEAITVLRAELPQFAEAFVHEFRNRLERVMALVGILTDDVAARKAFYALEKGNREKKANAIEVMHELLGSYPQTGQRVSTVLETYYLHKTHHSGSFATGSVQSFVSGILEQGVERYMRYTLAVALQVSLENGWNDAQIQAYRRHPEMMLRELALSRKVVATHTEENIETLTMSSPTEYEGESRMLTLEKIMFLKSTALFADTPGNILTELASITEEQYLEKDKTLFEKGDLGDCLFIIYSGTIKIHDGAVEFSRMGKRDFFGELALIDPEPRSASATALEDTILLRISQEDFQELTDERPEVAWGLLRILVKRLRNQNERLLQQTQKAGA